MTLLETHFSHPQAVGDVLDDSHMRYQTKMLKHHTDRLLTIVLKLLIIER